MTDLQTCVNDTARIRLRARAAELRADIAAADEGRAQEPERHGHEVRDQGEVANDPACDRVGGAQPLRSFAMIWTVHDYPSVIENLPSGVRRKAIELANSLIEQGLDEAAALHEAMGRSRAWAKRDLCGLLGSSSRHC